MFPEWLLLAESGRYENGQFYKVLKQRTVRWINSKVVPRERVLKNLARSKAALARALKKAA